MQNTEGLLPDELPNRFAHHCNVLKNQKLAPTNEKRTALARILSTPTPPPGRTPTPAAPAYTNPQKAAEVERRVQRKLQRFSAAEVAGVLARVDADKDEKVTSPQLRDALARLLVDLSDGEYETFWTRLDPIKRGVVPIKSIVALLSKTSRPSSASHPTSKPASGSMSRPATAAVTRPPTAQTSKMAATGALQATGALRATGQLSEGSERVVKRIRAKVQSVRQQVWQKLNRLDQTKTGSVAAPKFFEILEHFELGLGRQEQHMLMETFGDKTGCRVQYRDLFKHLA